MSQLQRQKQNKQSEYIQVVVWINQCYIYVCGRLVITEQLFCMLPLAPVRLSVCLLYLCYISACVSERMSHVIVLSVFMHVKMHVALSVVSFSYYCMCLVVCMIDALGTFIYEMDMRY